MDKDGQETLVDSTQDDDVESDEEVMQSGVQTSYKDLLAVKDYLKLKPDRVKTSLRTFKLWAPLFGGRLPYLKDKRRDDQSRSLLTNRNRHY